MPVKMPVSNLDCDAILHPKKRMSSRKYFNYGPYFTGILWNTNPNGLVMAIAHKKFDVRGVQFHPESIMTEHGKKIIKNWLVN